MLTLEILYQINKNTNVIDDLLSHLKLRLHPLFFAVMIFLEQFSNCLLRLSVLRRYLYIFSKGLQKFRESRLILIRYYMKEFMGVMHNFPQSILT